MDPTAAASEWDRNIGMEFRYKKMARNIVICYKNNRGSWCNCTVYICGASDIMRVRKKTKIREEEGYVRKENVSLGKLQKL